MTYTGRMKRSLQEVAELVVFGLIALLVGTGLLWLVGWILSLGGLLLKSLAGLLWLLLRYIVPIAIVAGLVYFLVKAAQDRQAKPASAAAGSDGGAPQGAGTAATAMPAAVDASHPVAEPTPEPAPSADAVPSAAPVDVAADPADVTEAAADVDVDVDADAGTDEATAAAGEADEDELSS